ncbi:MAG: N-acetylmuramic acid 6-phosphate etherase [Pyrinomonadaceae bacterium]
MIPITESDNEATSNIDKAATIEAVQLINNEDKLVAVAVEKVLPEIAAAIDKIVERIQGGGRLFYVGSGTSGRLGVLDASEIPPTFGVSYDLVQGVIAGGYDALYKASESSEDEKSAGAEDLKRRGLTGKDSVIGIAASGRTPYTIGAVEYAKSIGCFTACIVCNPVSELGKAVDNAIVPIVGPEAITGSSRMKAGTAQKMVLNMISTVTMIRLGYVKGNRMTNMKSSNEKLKGRSLRILLSETNLSENAAAELLTESGGDLRVALVMAKLSVERNAAEDHLLRSGYVVEKAVEIARSSEADQVRIAS